MSDNLPGYDRWLDGPYQRDMDAQGEAELVGKCDDCGKMRPLRDYDADAGDPPQAVHYEVCEDCYEERVG